MYCEEEEEAYLKAAAACPAQLSAEN